MAIVDPRLTRTSNRTRYELKIHDLAPTEVLPNGDRYVVEVLDIDETVEFGQLLVVTQVPEQGNPNDPMAPPQVERRGIMAAVIVAVGNGHLLGLSDYPPQGQAEQRPWASVPMFYKHGDVVFVDHNAKGRALKIAGRECRIVNQLDILAAVPKLKLKATKDGGWKQAE